MQKFAKGTRVVLIKDDSATFNPIPIGAIGTVADYDPLNRKHYVNFDESYNNLNAWWCSTSAIAYAPGTRVVMKSTASDRYAITTAGKRGEIVRMDDFMVTRKDGTGYRVKFDGMSEFVVGDAYFTIDTSPVINPSADTLREIKRLVRRGDKIGAIKALRASEFAAGRECHLKAAKDYVESLTDLNSDDPADLREEIATLRRDLEMMTRKADDNRRMFDAAQDTIALRNADLEHARTEVDAMRDRYESLLRLLPVETLIDIITDRVRI